MVRESAETNQYSAPHMRLALIFIAFTLWSCKKQGVPVHSTILHEGVSFGSDSHLNWGRGSTELQYLVIREGPVEQNPYFRIKKGIPIFESDETEIQLDQKDGVNFVVLGKKQFHGNIEMPLEEFDQWLHKTSGQREYPEEPFFDLISAISTTKTNAKLVIQSGL